MQATTLIIEFGPLGATIGGRSKKKNSKITNTLLLLMNQMVKSNISYIVLTIEKYCICYHKCDII